jgi:hypothetical protein
MREQVAIGAHASINDEARILLDLGNADRHRPNRIAYASTVSTDRAIALRRLAVVADRHCG